jgi:hypothetical protein
MNRPQCGMDWCGRGPDRDYDCDCDSLSRIKWIDYADQVDLE